MAPILITNPAPLALNPAPLTPESFAPYGTAIVPPLPRHISSPPPLSTLQSKPPVPVLANQNSALKYSDISPLLNNYPSNSPSGVPSTGKMTMFSCFPRQLRPVIKSNSPTLGNEKSGSVFDVTILERHPFTTQTFTPIDLSSQSSSSPTDPPEPYFLVIVAPTLKGATAVARSPETGQTVMIADPPDLSRVQAFVATGGQAVTYGAGTWHAPMVVVGSRRVDFVVVQFANGVADEDCQEVAFGGGVVVEVGGIEAGSSSLKKGAKL